MSQFVLTFPYLSSWLILPPLAFHILLHATVFAMEYTPNVVSKRCLFFIFKHSLAPKRSWKISRGGPGKVLDFFPVKEWEPWLGIFKERVSAAAACDSALCTSVRSLRGQSVAPPLWSRSPTDLRLPVTSYIIRPVNKSLFCLVLC